MRDAIVAEYSHLVGPIAMRLARRLPASFDAEDLAQVGMVALIEAAEKAASMQENPAHQVAYLKCRIRGAMLDSVKRAAYRDATHAPITQAADPPAVNRNPEELAAQAEADRLLTEAREALPPRQREVLEYRYQEGLTQRETGQALGGLSQPTVMQHERNAVRSLAASWNTRRRCTTTGKHRGPLRPPLAA